MNEQTNQQTDFANQWITKQDAIKAVKYGALSSATLFGRSDAGMTALRETVMVIEQLPPAQPEIIRCKNCKNSEHWYRDRRRCFLWSEDGISVFDDGFCNYAERRHDD